MHHEQAFWATPLGERIRLGREAADLSQEQLAEVSGLGGGRTTICRYESGATTPRADAIQSLRAVLGWQFV